MKNLLSTLIVTGSSLSVHGGRERWVLEVAKLLKNFGSITVLSLADYHGKNTDRLKLIRSEITGHSISYHEIKTIKTGLKVVKRIPLSLRELVRVVMHHETIYVAGDIFFGVLFSLLAFLLGKRGLILGLHVSPSIGRLRQVLPFLKILSGLGVIRALHVVNIVDLIKLKRLIKLNVIYVPNFVDCAKFKPKQFKRSDVFQVLYVGALDFKKGIDLVLKVAERFKRAVPESKFIITSYGGSWEDIVLRHAEEGLVDYRGFVTDEELIELYGESHVLIMPSREEPFGLAAIEAQACGTPVITSDLPAFRLTVKEGVTGFRVKSYEVNGWVETLLKIYMSWKFDKQSYISMCNKAREHVLKNFYFNVMKRIVKLLLECKKLTNVRSTSYIKR